MIQLKVSLKHYIIYYSSLSTFSPIWFEVHWRKKTLHDTCPNVSLSFVVKKYEFWKCLQSINQFTKQMMNNKCNFSNISTKCLVTCISELKTIYIFNSSGPQWTQHDSKTAYHKQPDCVSAAKEGIRDFKTFSWIVFEHQLRECIVLYSFQKVVDKLKRFHVGTRQFVCQLLKVWQLMSHGVHWGFMLF